MGRSVLIVKMKISIGIILILLELCHTQKTKSQLDTMKNKKTLSLFSIVTFPNNQCTAKSDNTEYGTCLTSSECIAKSGSTDGNCAAGFGVCCVFTLSTCGAKITENCTYITNPSYPTTYTTTGTCSHTITPLNSEICEIRLDFDNFDITETTAGVCTDSFAVTGNSGQNPLDLCGTLTGFHLYFENARSTSTSTLQFTIVTGGTWKIKVGQIECSNPTRPYPDCDQFFTGVSGTVTSYNWPNVQLRAKDYNICIRREEGYCGIQYSQAVPYTSPDSFDLSSLSTVTGAVNGEALAVTAAAQGYISIAGVVGSSAIRVFSGEVLASPLTTIANQQTVPGALTVTGLHMYRIEHTQANVAQTGYEGFSLNYYQAPCNAYSSYYQSTGL